MNIEIPPFYIGQEVVAILDHSQGAFKKGDEFIVKSLSKTKWCSCRHGWYVGFGQQQSLTPGSRAFRCTLCNQIGHYKTIPVVFWARCFAAKHQYGSFIAMSELVKEGLELTCVN